MKYTISLKKFKLDIPDWEWEDMTGTEIKERIIDEILDRVKVLNEDDEESDILYC